LLEAEDLVVVHLLPSCSARGSTCLLPLSLPTLTLPLLLLLLLLLLLPLLVLLPLPSLLPLPLLLLPSLLLLAR